MVTTGHTLFLPVVGSVTLLSYGCFFARQFPFDCCVAHLYTPADQGLQLDTKFCHQGKNEQILC